MGHQNHLPPAKRIRSKILFSDNKIKTPRHVGNQNFGKRIRQMTEESRDTNRKDGRRARPAGFRMKPPRGEGSPVAEALYIRKGNVTTYRVISKAGKEGVLSPLNHSGPAGKETVVCREEEKKIANIGVHHAQKEMTMTSFRKAGGLPIRESQTAARVP